MPTARAGTTRGPEWKGGPLRRRRTPKNRDYCVLLRLLCGHSKGKFLVKVKHGEPELHQAGRRASVTRFSPTPRPGTARSQPSIYFSSWEQVSLTHSVTTSSVSSVARPWLSWVNTSSLSRFNLRVKEKKGTRVMFKTEVNTLSDLKSWDLSRAASASKPTPLIPTDKPHGHAHNGSADRHPCPQQQLLLPRRVWPQTLHPWPGLQCRRALGEPGGRTPVQWTPARAGQARAGSVLCPHTLTSRARSPLLFRLPPLLLLALPFLSHFFHCYVPQNACGCSC